MNDRSDLELQVIDWLRGAAPARAPERLMTVTLERVAHVGQDRPFGGRRFDAWIGVAPRLRWALVLLVLAALLGAFAGAAALIQREPLVRQSGVTNGWVAFAEEGRVRRSPSTIYLVRDGVQERRLVGDSGYSAGIRAVCPAFSPDGTRLAYAEAAVTPAPPAIGSIQPFPGSFEASDRFVIISTLDRAGSPIGTDVRIPIVVGPGTDDGCPTWSPDGQHVAYLGGSPSAASGLTIADVHGQVTNTFSMPAGGFGHLVWSPDGGTIAAEYETGIWFTPVAGGQPHSISLPPGLATNDIAWSPDGTRIAVGGSPGLVFRAGDPQQVVERSVGGSPTWSPDGLRLASLQSSDATGQNQIACIGCRTDVSIIANDPRTIRGFIWSPDGTRLLYVADDGQSGALMTVTFVDSRPSVPVQLTQLPHYLEFTSAMFLSWQPVFP